MKMIKKHLPEIEKTIISKNNIKAYTIKSLKIDYMYRLYTIVNLKPENIKNSELYGYSYFDNEIKKFIKDLNIELGKIGLTELIGLSNVEKKTPTSVLVVVEFKFLDIGRFFKRLFFSFILFFIAFITALFYFL
jgi:hypothetical protein